MQSMLILQERETERERETDRETERQTDRQTDREFVCVCICACVCVGGGVYVWTLALQDETNFSLNAHLNPSFY